MPRNVNPASISVGAGIAPQGTVEDNSFRHPQRDVEPLRAHLLDPNNAHMAAAIGIVDAGGFFSSTDVEGALQELGGGGAAGRHNGLVIGGTFTSGPGLLTLDTPTEVLIGGVLASFGGATVVLPPSVTRYVWIDPTTSTLTATAGLPPVSSEPILIAKVVTDAGANVVSSQDARFFVANLDRKVDYTLRSDGTAVNDASEACFVTLDAALFWLENYVATGQERKALVLVRGAHAVNSTVVVPAGIPNIEFRGEGNASFTTGAVLLPMFDVSGTVGVTFTNLTFRCDHAASTAIATDNAALACSNVTVQNCVFGSGAGLWGRGVRLYQGAPATQTGHRVLGCQFTVSTSGVSIDRAVDCMVRDCSLTGNNTAGSHGVSLIRIGGVGENCLVDNVRANDFGSPFFTNTATTTLRKCMSMSGGIVVGGVGAVVDGCFFAGITDTTAGLQVTLTAIGTVVSNTTVISTTVWAALDDPSGILLRADGAVATGCSVSGFYNAAGNNGAGVRVTAALNNKVLATDVGNCHTGVEVIASAATLIEGCTLTPRVRGIYSNGTSPATRVVSTIISLDNATGLHGIVLEGVGPTVVDCQVTTGRAFNAYGAGDTPAGVLCGAVPNNGPYIIEGCTFTNLYNSVGQRGGGIVYTDDLFGMTVSGCTFNNGGIYGDSPTNVNSVLVTGCTFNATVPTLQRMGVALSSSTNVFDTNVSDCLFKFNTSDTGFAVDVVANAAERLVVADCTYTAVSAPGGIERFVNIVVGAGNGVVIEGNTVDFPSDNTLGPLLVQGVDALVVANNSFTSVSPSTATALETNAKTVTVTGNTFVGMNGIALAAAVGGFLPSLQATGNTFDGADDTVSVGVRVLPANAGLTAFNTQFSGNVFSACLTAVVFTNPLNTLTLNGFHFTGNTVSGCRNGVSVDTDTAGTVRVSGNTFAIYNYAFFQSNTSAVLKNVAVDNNAVSQGSFVLPAVANGLITVSGRDVNTVSVSQNVFEHDGTVGAVYADFGGPSAVNISIDGNSVRNENATLQTPILLDLNPSAIGPAPECLNISLSRNKVYHFGNGFAAVKVLVSTVDPLLFRSFVLDENEVVAKDNASDQNHGVVLQAFCGGVTPASLSAVSLSKNSVFASGTAVFFDVTNAGGVGNVSMNDNHSRGGLATTAGSVYFSCIYLGVPPVSAVVRGVNISRNSIANSLSNFGVRVISTAPVMNLSVDDNALVVLGNGAATAGEGSVSLFLSNASAFPTRDSATNVSVCRNKVTGDDNSTFNGGEAAILLLSVGGLATEGKNITVDDNEVYNHLGSGVAVRLGYGSIQNLSVSGNKIRSVNSHAVLVDALTNLNGAAISNNLIQRAFNTGGLVGQGVIEVDVRDGNGLVFADNRIGVASRRGIYVDGTGATGTLEGTTFTGNTIDFTNGVAAAEEGIYLYWEDSLVNTTATGNNIRAADVGIYVDGGPLASVVGIPTEVSRVTVTGNTVSANDHGLWVANHTTDSGLGATTLNNVVVSNNTIVASSAGGLTFGVNVETVFSVMENIIISGNTVDMGAASKGNAVRIDTGDVVSPSRFTITDNTTVYGDIGIALIVSERRLSEVSVCRNSIDTVGRNGIYLYNMNALRNVAVDDNTVQSVVSLGGFTGYGILLYADFMATDSTNVSVSSNRINNTEKSGILVWLLRNTGTPTMRSLTLSHNKVGNWNVGTFSAADTPAIAVQLCVSGAEPHPLNNLDVSHNSCVKFGDDWVSGFQFFLDENTQQVVFAHNQVRLDNQANAKAMNWTFSNTGGAIPKNFSFMGNQFRNTNGAVPTYAGVEGDFATFYGNIGSAANFWTNFALNFDNGGVGTVLPATINNHNIDDGT